MNPLFSQYISSQKTEQLMLSSVYISNVSEDLVIFYCYYQLMFKNVPAHSEKLVTIIKS